VVAITDEGGVAAKAGLAPGVVVTSVGGHVVRGASHLEALFLQTNAATLELVFQYEEETKRTKLARP